MADQKKWFKVWTSLLIDFDHLSDADIGRWTRLGCRIALVGNSGKVKFEGGWNHLARFLGIDHEEAKSFVQRVCGLCVEEGKTVHGELIVSMQKWYEYQEDSTYKERIKRTRDKRRGEEKRTEENRTEQKREEGKSENHGPKQVRAQHLCDQDWIESLKSTLAYEHIDIPTAYSKMIAWCEVHRKQPTRRRLIGWLNREDKPLQQRQIMATPIPKHSLSTVPRLSPAEAKAKYGHLGA